jgi:hypothetical protein
MARTTATGSASAPATPKISRSTEVGREAYQNPGILASVDREIFGVAGADADPVAVVC